MSIVPKENYENFDWFEDMDFLEDCYLNKYEKNHKIDQHYIMKLWDYMCEKFEKEEWVNRLNEENTKCWNSPNGSHISKDHVCIHVEGWLDSKFPHEMVVDAIQNTETRKLWDKNVDTTEVIEQIAKNAYVRKTKTKKIPFISQREVIEKKIVLKRTEEGRVATYIFSSSCPEEHYPKEKAVRATNLFCILKLEKLEDGRTKYSSFAQVDPNFFFNVMTIFKRLCGGKIREWYNNLTNFLDASLKQQGKGAPQIVCQ